MKILLINKFLYPKGGDAISTITTGNLMKSRGHNVIYWGMAHPLNPDYLYKDLFVNYVDFNKSNGILKEFQAFLNILYSFEAKNKIKKLLKIYKPDIVHLNNFAHQISPSILDVFAKQNISTVMTMRDYKLVCPSYTMFIDGRICEACKGGKYYHCLLNKCTKNSYTKSMINTIEMYLHHKILHIYDKIDVIISPSRFLKEKLKDMGFKKEIVYLQNFIYLKDYVPNYNFEDKTICYFGRLSLEKGLFTLLNAVKGINIKLKIIGEGPIKENLISKVKYEKLNNVYFLGYKLGEELKNEIKNSIYVVIPSEWYENNPRSVIEAFALSKPVIGSRIGGIPELVKDGKTGYTFEAGNVEDLRNKIEFLVNDPNSAVEMGKNARRFVEKKLNSEKHYQELIKIYQMAIDKYL